MTNTLPDPTVSVVFVTAEDDDSTLVAMLTALSRQTISRHIEVVIVAQEGDAVDIDPRMADAFHSIRLARCERRAFFGRALVIGIKAATAPLVALIEDHCRPHVEWAEALVRRHADGYAVVGPQIMNANADSSLSWTNYVLTHSRWSPSAVAGEVDTVAGDNCLYERRVLLEKGDELDSLLSSATILHQELRDAGHRVFLEPQAKLEHITPSTLRAYVGSFFYSGRLFAALLSRHWSWPRRAWRAAMSPMISLRWVGRLIPAVSESMVGPRVWRVRALMVIAIPVSAVGSIAGLLFGAGGSYRYTSDIYFHRHAHLRHADQALVETMRSRTS